ncbi:carboxylesterase family protein [Streptomyces sp. enrichment culture]|uniref:carboxylesterase family protein n=1 Tax=Streptomyces sp. enrichment culture TaxID=1795815 RepID=UPI003F5570D9
MHVTVPTTAGRVRGRREGEVTAFLGVPCAAPPFGPRRLCPPEPPGPWAGVRDAFVPGPSAPRPGYLPATAGLLEEAAEPGEDCLGVDVWTPAPGRTGGRLPVMVRIHGGAFRNGAGSLRSSDGARLAADGVVCVTLDYRLGAEGFLLLPDGTSNLGLLDRIAALERVRDNIAGFGGDPENVTVFGVAEARAAHGADTCVYEFARPSPAPGGALGACHRAEIGFVFGHLSDPLVGPDAPRELSDGMREAWISFARTGRPGAHGGTLPPWPPWAGRRLVMRLGDGAARTHEDPGSGRRKLWEPLCRPRPAGSRPVNAGS